MNLLRFPLALYLRLFGAAGLGYIVGGAGKEPTFVALGVVCFAFGATLAGWMMMRPLMREAKAAIKNASKMTQPPEEEANDAPH
jgi:hypothetical protein